jgi:LacI family transcriptional regulator
MIHIPKKRCLTNLGRQTQIYNKQGSKIIFFKLFYEKVALFNLTKHKIDVKLVNMKLKTDKKYSLARVAAELGTSKTAVSFVVNGLAREKGISAALEQRILDFCKATGFRPNIHAQRMNSQYVENIGVLLDRDTALDEETPFSDYNASKVIGGIAAAADLAGYRFSVQLYSEGMDNKKVFEWFKNKEIDGLIYYGFEMPSDWRKTFQENDFKVVGVSIDPAFGIPCVNIDNYQASLNLTGHLIRKGHRKFIYIGGTPKSWPALERYRGFRDALQKENLEFSEEEDFYRADFVRDAAEQYIRERWMHGRLDTDAIVCASDNMAVGVIRALTAAGCQVPEQVAVTGADNILLGQFITPPLTTFDYLPFEQGKAAFKLLHEHITKPKSPANICLKTSLLVRQSG